MTVPAQAGRGRLTLRVTRATMRGPLPSCCSRPVANSWRGLLKVQTSLVPGFESVS
jgi:hypothetical protein